MEIISNDGNESEGITEYIHQDAKNIFWRLSSLFLQDAYCNFFCFLNALLAKFSKM